MNYSHLKEGASCFIETTCIKVSLNVEDVSPQALISVVPTVLFITFWHTPTAEDRGILGFKRTCRWPRGQRTYRHSPIRRCPFEVYSLLALRTLLYPFLFVGGWLICCVLYCPTSRNTTCSCCPRSHWSVFNKCPCWSNTPYPFLCTPIIWYICC